MLKRDQSTFESSAIDLVPKWQM